jgi:DNA-binding transcriptional LysR family regulator
VELRHIRYFVAVAEEGNFTRAAARLGIGQPPLSQQIKDLETEIGVLLFHRVPHGAELTEAGEAFLAEAREILAGAGRAKAAAMRAARGENGTLRLGFTGSAAFNPTVAAAIRAFRTAHPNVALTLEDANTVRLLERIRTGDLHAAFIRPGPGELDGIRLRHLREEPMVVALPSNHRLADRASLPLGSLAEDPFILFPRAIGTSLYDSVIAACRLAGFEPVAGQPAPQIASIVNLVAAGLGVSVVPLSIAQIKLEGVAYRPIEGSGPVARLALASSITDRSAVVRNFSALLLRHTAPAAP